MVIMRELSYINPCTTHLHGSHLPDPSRCCRQAVIEEAAEWLRGVSIRGAPEFRPLQSLLDCCQAFLHDLSICDHHCDAPLCVLVDVLLNNMNLHPSACVKGGS